MRLKPLLAALVVGGSSLSAGAVSNISATNPFAHGANIGWLNWRPSAADGVEVGSLFLSGNVWSANCGWISLGDGKPANGHHYQNNTGTDFGVNLEADGTLSGTAYGANIGWITFTDRTATGKLPADDVPRVDLKSGRFHGFGYSANCGWINLGSDFNGVRATSLEPGPDTDGDGIPDAWELQFSNNLNELTASGDLDSDGISDRDEYLADTNPTNASDVLKITNISAQNEGATVDLTWRSKPSRCYLIQTREDLYADGWLDMVPPDLISPDSGDTTTKTVGGGANLMRFFRVQGVVPGKTFEP